MKKDYFFIFIILMTIVAYVLAVQGVKTQIGTCPICAKFN